MLNRKPNVFPTTVRGGTGVLPAVEEHISKYVKSGSLNCRTLAHSPFSSGIAATLTFPATTLGTFSTNLHLDPPTRKMRMFSIPHSTALEVTPGGSPLVSEDSSKSPIRSSRISRTSPRPLACSHPQILPTPATRWHSHRLLLLLNSSMNLNLDTTCPPIRPLAPLLPLLLSWV